MDAKNTFSKASDVALSQSGVLGPALEQTANQPAPSNPIITRPIILGDLTLASPTTFTTIGANGAATALTANPVGYLTVMVGNTQYQIPYYNPA